MWYRTGTITVTNGSTTVTGSGTLWIANAGVGEALYAPDGRLYEITNIASDTSITIAPAYLGSGASGQAYTFVPSQSYIRDLASQAADLVNNYASVYNTTAQGKFPDGTLAAPAVRFSDDLDTGFYRSAANEVTFVAGGVSQFKYNTTGLVFTGAGGGTIANLTTTGNTTLGDAAADTVTINGTPTVNAPTTITVNSATNALRITQTGAGNALLVEDSTNPDATPFVIDQSGKVFVGSTVSAPSPDANGTQNDLAFQVNGVSSLGAASASLAYFANSSTGSSVFNLNKSRSAALGHAVLNSGDTIASIQWNGSDGTGFIRAASISAFVDGTPGTGDMPGRLVFSTTADGASSPTERMRIDSAGRVGIGVNRIDSNLAVSRNITGSATFFGVLSNGEVQSDVTSATLFYTSARTQAAAFTLTSLVHYSANQSTIGATSAVTTQFGFSASSSLIGATNNYGFYGNIPAGTGRWNFYAAGSAANYFAGAIETSGLTIAAGNANPIISVGSAQVSTGTCAIEIGAGRTGNGLAYIDLIGDTTYTDHGLRIIRGSTGANASSSLIHRGTGAFILAAQEAGNISLRTTNAERLGIDSAGLVTLATGSGLSIARTAVTAPAASDGNVFSGTYTPTLTNGANVASSTATHCQYMRVGNVITVSGNIIINASSANTNTQVTATIPVTSAFTGSQQCGGCGTNINTTGNKDVLAIEAIASSNTVLIRLSPETTGERTYSFSFTYRVI